MPNQGFNKSTSWFPVKGLINTSTTRVSMTQTSESTNWRPTKGLRNTSKAKTTNYKRTWILKNW